ncbi:MAG: hypothetical protein NTZ74_10290 [Chloroflexi bacterium]|nr:hypothetical protein [Chloroflexota bacterium]
MNMTATHRLFRNPFQTIAKARVRSGSIYVVITILAMVAFEALNYDTTAYALRDLLGEIRFAGIPWATLMAIAFCGLDFAGIARLITQNGLQENRKESWYLFGAWLIAATFNATLTWWGISIAISGHTLKSASMVNLQTLITIVPVMVAIMVWIIRILIIGSLTSALERINGEKRKVANLRRNPVVGEKQTQSYNRQIPTERPSNSIAAHSKNEPTYHKLASSQTSSSGIRLTPINHSEARKF